MGLNLDQITQLKEIEQSSGQEGLFSTIVNMFLDSIEQEKTQLVGLLKEGQFESASRLAHSMKSSSRNVGADDLAKIFQYIEDMGAGRGNPEDYVHETMVTHIESLLLVVKTDLQSLL